MLSLSTRDARLGQKYSGKPLKAKELESPRLLTFELDAGTGPTPRKRP